MNSRINNAKNNMIYGMLNKIITLLLPFTGRTVLIRELGSEYLGLSGLLTSILTVLNLTELGFSSAMVFAMYKPIAEGRSDEVNALLNFYRIIYRRIGVATIVIGIIPVPFLSLLIHGPVPSDVNITYLYLIYLSNTAMSYFIFAHYNSLLSAIQRNDVLSNISTFINITLCSTQIVVLAVFKNFYVYVIMINIITLLNNLITFLCAKRIAPAYRCEGKISREIERDIFIKVKGLMITKLQMVSRNAFDNILIATFSGLTISAIYNNYYCIMTVVAGFITLFSTSITAGIGNSVAIETVEKNYLDMNRFNLIYMWVSGWFTVCLLCLYQPFMKIWVGSNLMFDFVTVILFCVYFYSLRMGDIRSIYLEVNGLWWENRHKAIFESLANLVLNYFLGKYFGVHGILAATIIVILFINFGVGSKIVFKHYFKEQHISEYFIKHLYYAAITTLSCVVTGSLCSKIELSPFYTLIVRIVLCTIIPNAIFIVFYSKTKEFKQLKPWIKKVINK